MSDREDETLRDVLRDAVPDAPDPGSWAGIARRRAVVRRRVTVGVVAGLVALLAIPTAVLSQDRDRAADPADQDGESGHVECAENRTEPDRGAAGTTESPLVPDGVVRVRFCDQSIGSVRLPRHEFRPDRGLEEELSPLREKQLPSTYAAKCKQPPGPSYRVGLLLTDGSTVELQGELSGCGRLTTTAYGDEAAAAQPRVTEAANELYTSLLHASRPAGDHPVTTSVAPCPPLGEVAAFARRQDAGQSFPSDDRPLAAIRVCRGRDYGHGVASIERSWTDDVAPAEWIRLGFDSSQPGHVDCAPTAKPSYVVVMRDWHGKQYAFSVDARLCGQIEASFETDRGIASPELLAALRAVHNYL